MLFIRTQSHAMTSLTPELIYNGKAELAEGPVWHDGSLWWVDIPAGTLKGAASASAEAKGMPPLITQVSDVTRHDECRALVEATASAFGGVDVIVHCAADIPHGGLGHVSDEKLESGLASIAKAAWWLLEAARPHLASAPGGGRFIAIGSVKSQIGHLKAGAGAAGLLKAVLALHHKVLPPSINFREPNPGIDFGRASMFVNTKAQPWERPASGTRIAAVSAFGFGGTNFHVVLEEHVPGMLTTSRKTSAQVPDAIGGGSGSSRSTYMGGTAIWRASEGVVEKGKRIAAGLLDVPEADIHFSDGHFRAAGTNRSAPLLEVAAIAAAKGQPLSTYYSWTREWLTFPNGTHVVEVEIDRDTGHLTLDRYTAVDDYGVLVNPMIAAGQEIAAARAETARKFARNFMRQSVGRIDRQACSPAHPSTSAGESSTRVSATMQPCLLRFPRRRARSCCSMSLSSQRRR